MKKQIIKVCCGVTVETKQKRGRHPLTEVNVAIAAIDSGKSATFYTNSPDFVSAIKYYGEKQNMETVFFLNGVSHGNDIEPIFENFNRAMDHLAKVCI